MYSDDNAFEKQSIKSDNAKKKIICFLYLSNCNNLFLFWLPESEKEKY